MAIMRRRKHLSYGYFPQDVCMEVLSRLPVKAVLRFRSVCKTWASVIDAPCFESMHLHHCNNNREKKKLLLLQWSHSDRKHWTLRWADTFRKIRDFDTEFTSSMLVICYIDGLLVLCDNPRHCYAVIVLNLSIRKYITLPSSPVLHENYLNLGIGYDSASDDYKLVAWSSSSSGQVYSLNSDTWKSQVSFEHARHFMFQYPQVFFEGTIHWIVQRPDDKDHLILTFDVHDEIVKYMKLPYPSRRGTRVLTIVDESLAIVDHKRKESCIWVMEKYGAIDSWTKRYTINLHAFEILYLKENGELFFANKRGGVKSYNIRTGEINHLAKTYPTYVYDMNNYVESLLLSKRADGQSLESFSRTKSKRKKTRKRIALHRT
ncbi:hypothetical protein Ancab_000397 [Ancistrocladus abbreviatus]